MTRIYANPHRRRGFTLMELMVVIIIMGLMAAMAGPRMMRWLQTIGQKGAANQLVSDLVYARAQAVRHGQTVSLRIDAAARYRVTVDNAAGDVQRVLSDVNLANVYRGTSITPATGRVAFDSRGTIRAGSITALSVARGSVSQQVCVSVVGRVYRGNSC